MMIAEEETVVSEEQVYNDMLDLDAIRAEEARRYFRSYVELMWHVVEPAHPFLANWHIDAICEHLQAVSEGKVQNLLITVPPGHAKSLIAAVLWPTWMWIDRPYWRVLCATYSGDLTLRDSLRSRMLLKSAEYQMYFKPKWWMLKDQDAKGYYQNNRMGFRYSTSVDGQSTGHRGDCIIVDDAISAKEGESQAKRENAVFWWDYAYANRLNDLRKGTRVMIGQRLHEVDLPGHVLKESKEDWVHLKLPTIFDGSKRCVTQIGWSDPRKKDDELLFPALFPQSVIDTEKKRLGSYGFSSQHQQEPSPAGGGKFQRAWFRYFEELEDYYVLHLPEGKEKRILKAHCWRFQTWDLAATDKESSCYTVGATWDITPRNELLLLNVHRFKAEAPDVKEAIEMERHRWSPQFQGIERAHYGIEVCQDWVRRGLPVKQLDADKDKVTRSMPASIMLENGRVYFKQNTHWLTDFEDELLKFNKGEYDDQVDTFSYAALVVGMDAPIDEEECKPLVTSAANQRGSFAHA